MIVIPRSTQRPAPYTTGDSVVPAADNVAVVVFVFDIVELFVIEDDYLLIAIANILVIGGG